MIKELQKQIEMQKQNLLQPINDVLEQLKKYYDYQTDIDLEKKIIVIALQTKDDNNRVYGRVNIIRTLNEAVLNTEVSLEYINSQDGHVLGLAAKPLSFDIDFLGYISHLALEILRDLEQESEVEVGEE